jgi:SAM-dependent methyltransferase
MEQTHVEPAEATPLTNVVQGGAEGVAVSGQATYIFDNAWARARERLTAVEARSDPGTVRNLEALDVRPGWHCLEVGAGGGSIADWLCNRVGRSGRVVAIDIDTRFVGQLDHPNLEVRTQDVAATGALETGVYDLVHARLLLEHVPGRDQALSNMVAALKPGGWIQLEELDHITLQPALLVDARHQMVWEQFREAYRRLMQQRGGDLDYGRRLFGLLTDHGLTNVSAYGHASVRHGGMGTGLGFSQTRAELVATGALDDNEMGAVLSMLDDPHFAFMPPLMVSARGQRPPR